MRLAAGIFFPLWVLLCGLIYQHAQVERQERLNENNLVLATTYRASVNMYRMAAEILFADVIERPEVIATFAEGVRGHGEAAARARGKLYRLLAPAYTHLKERGVQQLQFHSAEGYSFLRFDAPERFGDPLFDIRPSVRLTNTEQRATFSFETGRTSSGFRYVFPLFQGPQHLGSVETGVSFRSISAAMAAVDPGREYLLVLRKEVVERALFKDQRPLYALSPISREFLVEDPRLHLPNSPVLSATVEMLNARVKETPLIQSAMPAGRPFALAVATAGGDWVVAFTPIEDLLGANVAYVISYTRAPFLAELRRELWLSLIGTSLALGGLFWLTLRLLQSHARLQREKRHQQLITDTIADGLYVMDAQGRVVQVNPGFSEILGYPPDKIIGQIGHDIFHVHGDGGQIPVDRCPVISATRMGQDYAGEELFRHQDGRLLTVDLLCKPFGQEVGLKGSVTAFRDVTERKFIQERLLQSDRIKSEFIATASHELRTPLAVIQGYTELMREENGFSAEQLREFETIIYDKSIALEKIIDDLLDVSRIEAGRPLCLDIAPTDLVREIRQIVAPFEKEATRHRFSVDLAAPEVVLAVDRFKIIQVLENLLNNAVKFSPAGGEIAIAGQVCDGRFQVMVADQGVGIAPEQQQQVFEKFFRGDASNTAVPGFGLGLYLVKRIVEAHGGTLWVESTLGQGTKFFFDLPLDDR